MASSVLFDLCYPQNGLMGQPCPGTLMPHKAAISLQRIPGSGTFRNTDHLFSERGTNGTGLPNSDKHCSTTCAIADSNHMAQHNQHVLGFQIPFKYFPDPFEYTKCGNSAVQASTKFHAVKSYTSVTLTRNLLSFRFGSLVWEL